MNYLYCVAVLIWLVTPVSATEKKETVARTEQPQIESKTTQQRQPQKATDFQPTEKISADTIIAFPADI